MSIALGLFLLIISRAPVVLSGGWQSNGPPFPFVSDIAVPAQDEQVVYAGATNEFRDAAGDWQSPSAVFRSRDGGLTWETVANAPRGELLTAVAVNPFTPSRLLAVTQGSTGSRLYQTNDGGVNWYLTIDMSPCFGAAIAFDSGLPNREYVACEKVLRSDDGVTWTRLGVTVPYYSTLRPGVSGAIYAATPDYVVQSLDHGDTWTQIVRAPSECPSITALAVDPDDARTMYVGTGRFSEAGRFDCGGLYKTVDGGLTLSRTSLPDQFVTDIVVDPTAASTIYTCSVEIGFFSPPGRVSLSQNAGLSWIDFSPPSGPIARLVLAGSGRLLYGAVNQAWGSVLRRSIRKTRSSLPRIVP
jgi:hypothetical protein